MNTIATFFLWLWAVVTYIPRRLVALWPCRKPKLFHSIRVEEFPDKLKSGKVYLAGEGENLWAAAMICPCGCGEVIELNLPKQARPCWSVQEHSDGTITLTPSVWRQEGHLCLLARERLAPTDKDEPGPPRDPGREVP